MRLRLNLLENSHDYIISALELYKVADEYGTHREEKADIKNKVKWKLAFIALAQSFELLLKYGLFLINSNLVYADIDNKNILEGKTVGYRVALTRLKNFSKEIFNEDERIFIEKCFKIRNRFIHYEVDISTEELKNKFSKLYIMYKKTHESFVGDNSFFTDDHIKNIDEELEMFADSFVIFRGREIFKEYLEDFKNDIQKYSSIDCFITRDGQPIKRIAYGEENQAFLLNGHEELMSSIYDWTYCDDCDAKKGEYHFDGCDLEVCPICYGQKLSCNCEIDLLE